MSKIENLKNHLTHIKKLMSLCIVVIATLSSTSFSSSLQKRDFWNVQKKGANIFNRHVTPEDIKAAKKYGIQFIRLAPDKFISVDRDFLIGNADDYHQFNKEDLDQLKKILDICYQEKMPVVITMLSLPGSRWKQNNNGKKDLRIWKDEKYQEQAALFWQDLATALKDHPAIVGYNLLNEPFPERLFLSEEEHISTAHHEEVQKMLYALYSRIIKHIRLADKDTPIILDSSSHADAKTFVSLIPQEDHNVLYSFHMYEPYEYTNHKTNRGTYQYPCVIDGKQWNKKALREYLSAVIHFQKTHNIESNKILVGEFGGHRASPGLEKYFDDLIAIFHEEGWHFAFYAFREDTWDGMDYELGPQKLPLSYWEAVDRGEKPQLDRKPTYPAFLIIQKALDDHHNASGPQPSANS